jgi:HlyD family secretion protein
VHLSVRGELKAVNSKSITTPKFNRRPEIAWIVDEGAHVTAGERILAFDEEAMHKGLETAQSELLLALTKIKQSDAKLALTVADAEADITKAKLDYNLAKLQRTDSETVPLVERENARVNETKSGLAIRAAESALASLKLEAEAETQLLQLEVEERTRKVEQTEEELANAIIYAPTDGLVLVESSWNGKWQVGSRPWTGVALLTVPDMSSMKVVANVHEIDSPGIEVGQTGLVVIDAYPKESYTGTVSKVAELAVAKGDDPVKYLEFEVTLDEYQEVMRPGLSVRVELQLNTLQDKLSVPIEAIVAEEEHRFVWTKSLTGWSKVEVETFTENDTHVVVKGVEAGTTIALVDPHRWSEEGDRPAAVE